MTEDMGTRVERLVTTVEDVVKSLGELTTEMKATNKTIEAMNLQLALLGKTVDNHGREIFAGDSSSRIRTLEQQVKGLFALVAFVAVVLGGQFLALLSPWHIVSGAGK